MTKLNVIPRPNSEVASQIQNGEAVLVHPQKGKVRVLNAVGSKIWQAIDGKRSIGEIADEICNIYGLEKEVAEQDTLNFLSSLYSHGLISYDNS